MDYTSDDAPARDLAFDSESENSHFEDNNLNSGKEIIVNGIKQDVFEGNLGSAVQDSIIEPNTPELFY